ncbi:acyl carrier protein [Paenibacillus sp. PAMC 26794]|uniref:acyl carrier protein n=1 Tax=Paenibacillus sp. PAMC 26794 TaxID=1257080 RepID=UPI0002FAD3FB|nr:acyl carrier protein [Paenibacillus sp. PAMC 26794]
MNAKMQSVCDIVKRKAVIQKEVSLTTDLFRELGYDSFQFIELVVELESCFGIEIPEYKLLPENFTTAQNIVDLLEELN